MASAIKAPGIPASFEPVDWNPPGLPTDADEIVGHLVDPARRGELYPLYHQLRRVAPVHRNRPELFHGAHAFTAFAETDEIFKNPRVVNDPQVVEEAFTHGDGTFTGVMRDVMLWQQPEPHQRVRNLVKSAFTPRAIARWRPIAEQVASDLCDRIEAHGHAELVEQFNYELPFNVIAKILGIPDDDFPVIRQLAWDFARAGEKSVSPEVSARGDAAAKAFLEYFAELAETRRRAPTDDLLSSLLAAEAEGTKLSHTELIANCILLLQAGHETTQDLLGNAQVALLRHPDQLALLREKPELMKNAVEEFLRYDASVQINHRVILDGMTIGAVEIPPGGMVYIFLGAVNRDPARYDDPDRLDITRDVTHHLAFSFGAYYCIGAALARAEVAVGIDTLLTRFPDLRPTDGTFEWRNTLQLRGPQRLDVTW
jgi:pimeloyl-[acyl-carrier protein] synthase